MVLGAALFFGALALFLYNEYDSIRAEQSAATVMEQLIEKVEPQEAATEAPAVEIPEELVDPATFVMTEVEIDGYAYIGYLSLPDQGLDLPIMADLDKARLKIAPCRYYGTVKGNDLVLAAHNNRHFGGLKDMSEGERVIFTDMDGEVTYYEVVGLDILASNAVEEMTSGDFDLTLFTCTYGGKSRVTVYCDRVETE